MHQFFFVGRRIPEAAPADAAVPVRGAESNGALFLFENGRNPGVLLLIETEGQEGTDGVGRLSAPGTLSMQLDENVVWKQPRTIGSLSWLNP